MKYMLCFGIMLFWGGALCVAADEIRIDFTDPMFERLDAAGRKLLSEYAKAYPTIKSFYGNIRMDVCVENARNPSETDLEFLISNLRSKRLNEDEIEDVIERSKKMEQQHELRYRLQDGYGRVDTRATYSAFASADQHSEGTQRVSVSEAGITLFTPTMDYQLSKSDPSKQYFSLNAKRNKRKSNAEGLAIPLMYFDVAPFSSGYMPLELVVLQRPPLSKKNDPYFVEYVQQKEVAGKQIVEIRVARTDYADVFRVIRLSKDSWVVMEIYGRVEAPLSSGESEIRWDRSACTYDGVANGMPLLKTYLRSEGTLDKNSQKERLNRQISCEVKKIVPGPVDLAEFDVKQFLPPDTTIGEIVPAKMSTVRIASLVTGLILVFLGFYLNFRNKKRMRNFSTKEK